MKTLTKHQEYAALSIVLFLISIAPYIASLFA